MTGATSGPTFIYIRVSFPRTAPKHIFHTRQGLCKLAITAVSRNIFGVLPFDSFSITKLHLLRTRVQYPPSDPREPCDDTFESLQRTSAAESARPLEDSTGTQLTREVKVVVFWLLDLAGLYRCFKRPRHQAQPRFPSASLDGAKPSQTSQKVAGLQLLFCSLLSVFCLSINDPKIGPSHSLTMAVATALGYPSCFKYFAPSTLHPPSLHSTTVPSP
jgi:hypothetical protein